MTKQPNATKRLTGFAAAAVHGIPFEEVMAELPPEQRARIEARTAEMLAQETALRDVRRAMGKTQAAVARKLGISQGGVSELERRDDMLLSTLRGYLRALGADVYLMVELPGLPPMRLDDLGDLHPSQGVNPRKRAKPKGAAPRPARDLVEV